MDFRHAVPTTLSLPVKHGARSELLQLNKSVRLTEDQRLQLGALDEELQNGVFLLGSQCFAIICENAVSWYLTPLKECASERYRTQFLIQATHLHFRNNTLH